MARKERKMIVVFAVTTIVLVVCSWFFPEFQTIKMASGLLGFVTGMAYVIDGLAKTKKDVRDIAVGICWMLLYPLILVF